MADGSGLVTPMAVSIADARTDEASQLLTTLGLEHWTATLQHGKYLNVVSFTDEFTALDELVKRPADLTTEEKQTLGKALAAMRKHDVARAKDLPVADDDTLRELREIGRSFKAQLPKSLDLPSRLTEQRTVAMATPGGGVAGGVGGSGPFMPEKEAKWSTAVRDALYANLAAAQGGIELDDRDIPIEKTVAEVWKGAASDPPRTLPYEKTMWGRETEGAVIDRKKDGTIRGDVDRDDLFEEFDACLDTLAAAHSFRTDDELFAHYAAKATPADHYATDAGGLNVSIGARLPVVRTLGAHVKRNAVRAGLGTHRTGRYLARVYDGLLRRRNVQRCTLTQASQQLLESADLAPETRTSPRKKRARAKDSDSDDDDRTSGDDSPKKTPKRGKKPSQRDSPPREEEKCRYWYYTGKCKHGDECRYKSSHTSARKGKGKADK